jgi:MFS family permease
MIKSYAGFKDPRYEHANLRTTWKHLQGKPDIFRICLINFLLYVFYAIMIAYTPLYLSEHLHFPWTTIGWMFTIMLTPFVFLQLPLGRIADTTLGEKEFLTIGFIIAASATSILTFITGGSALVWALALFATRVGASMIEIMTDTYFFKKVTNTDTPALTFFRMMRPLGYIMGPLIATPVLLLFDFRYLFLTLGAVMLFGIYFSLSIKDTK